MKIKSYKDLDVWKKGIEIVDKIYKVTERFPPKELYGLAYCYPHAGWGPENLRLEAGFPLSRE